MVNKIIRVNKVSVYKLDKNKMKEILPRIPVRVIVVDEVNYIRALEMRSNDVQLKFLNMVKNGQIGLYAEHDNKIIAHAWLQIYNKKGKQFNLAYGELKKNEGLIHFCNTQIDYRGNNVYPFLIYQLALQFFRDSNTDKTSLYITTTSDNKASMRGLEKIGFCFIENRYVINLLNIIKLTISKSVGDDVGQ